MAQSLFSAPRIAACAIALAAPVASAAATYSNDPIITFSSPSEIAPAPKSAIANAFDIVVNFAGGLTASQQNIFENAALLWESLITGNRYDLALPALEITAEGVAIDGQGGVLGQAGPQTATRTTGAPQDYAYATTGQMQFDSADLANIEASGTLFDVIVHEMAHVIGFGTLWNPGAINPFFLGTQNVYRVTTESDGMGGTTEVGEFFGGYGVAVYNTEFFSGAPTAQTYVPVDTVSGPGTRDSHWDEVLFAGGSLDLMTGFIGGPTALADAPLVATTLSATTVASFADLGYTTVATDPISTVPLPASVMLILTALGGLLTLSRRRTTPT